MRFVGKVTEVNNITGYVHLANREYMQAVSFVDRSGRFNYGDLIYLEASDSPWDRMKPELCSQYIVRVEDCHSWQHSCIGGVKITNHVRQPAFTILDPEPTQGSRVAPMGVSGAVRVVLKAAPVQSPPSVVVKKLHTALLGSLWKSTDDDAVVKIDDILLGNKGRLRCKLSYVSTGRRTKKYHEVDLATVMSRYQEHQPQVSQ